MTSSHLGKSVSPKCSTFLREAVAARADDEARGIAAPVAIVVAPVRLAIDTSMKGAEIEWKLSANGTRL